MNLKVKVAALPIPPGEYKREDFNQIIRKLNQLIDNVFNPGDIVCSSVQIIDAPENGYGLPVNGVYVDASGILRVARLEDVFAPSFRVRVKLNNVTVS